MGKGEEERRGRVRLGQRNVGGGLGLMTAAELESR